MGLGDPLILRKGCGFERREEISSAHIYGIDSPS